MKISEMSSKELLIFLRVTDLIGVTAISTDGAKEGIDILEEQLEDEKKEQKKVLSKEKFEEYMNQYKFRKSLLEEVRKIISNLEAGEYE